MKQGNKEGNMMVEEKLHYCQVSDSFVHPNMKLSNGKNGNGESRLFISCSKEICEKIQENKSIKIHFDDKYISNLESYVSNESNFRKKDSNRIENWKKNIKDIDCKRIIIEMQNGNVDVSRHYIGQSPHRHKKNKSKEEKENIKRWDTFRKCLIPTKTVIEFLITNEKELILNVLYNNNHLKHNKPSGCSFVSLDFFNNFGRSNNIEIQHAMNGGEFKERKENGYFWPVDGYHSCEKHKCSGSRDNPCFWDNYVFEFQGDYWHKNKKSKDEAKQKFYIKKGYKWFEIFEHEYINKKKLIKHINQLS